METRNVTCIQCPMGCLVTVEMEAGEIVSVSGNTCKRGEAYARKELTHPTRILTSTVRVLGGVLPVVSVKTSVDIPKEYIEKVMGEINKMRVSAPVQIGDVLLEDIAGTGADIIATKYVGEKTPTL